MPNIELDIRCPNHKRSKKKLTYPLSIILLYLVSWLSKDYLKTIAKNFLKKI